MSSQQPEPRNLFRNEHLDGTHESRQSGRTTGVGHERSPYRTQRGGATVTLRIKPDRRRAVTQVDPENERRRR